MGLWQYSSCNSVRTLHYDQSSLYRAEKTQGAVSWKSVCVCVSILFYCNIEQLIGPLCPAELLYSILPTIYKVENSLLLCIFLRCICICGSHQTLLPFLIVLSDAVYLQPPLIRSKQKQQPLTDSPSLFTPPSLSSPPLLVMAACH